MVNFRTTGEVGEIEIIRWAGFGWVQSTERPIRQLKFKPATRDGNPISARALILQLSSLVAAIAKALIELIS